jgi:ElaB/YqjD/DUF883 family membrane-anchored ribosome-binding protein
MAIDFNDARKAVRRGARSAGHALDVAHESSRRGLRQVQGAADEMFDAGDYAARSTSSAAQSAHEWMEEKPHLAALLALGAGVLIGAILAPRR